MSAACRALDHLHAGTVAQHVERVRRYVDAGVDHVIVALVGLGETALDRYGARRCMLVCAAIAVAGALLFAWAPSPAWLIVARVLLGLGSSCYLMAPLALYARRYPPERFTALAGIQIGIGTVGTLLVTAQLAFATATIGWRMTFMVVAGVVVIGALLVLLVVPRDTPGDVPGAHRETLRESLAGVMQVVRMRGFWPIFLMQFVAMGALLIERVPHKKHWAIFFFLIYPVLAFILLYGGFGLRRVDTSQWGGLMLTLVLSTTGIVTSLPLGVFLALGRRSRLPVIRPPQMPCCASGAVSACCRFPAGRAWTLSPPWSTATWCAACSQPGRSG